MVTRPERTGRDRDALGLVALVETAFLLGPKV